MYIHTHTLAQPNIFILYFICVVTKPYEVMGILRHLSFGIIFFCTKCQLILFSRMARFNKRMIVQICTCRNR